MDKYEKIIKRVSGYTNTPPSLYSRKFSKFNDEMKMAIDVSLYMKQNFSFVRFRMDYAGMNLSRTQRGQMKIINPYRGHPDFTIYKPSFGFNGLHLELKTHGTRIRRTRDGKKRNIIRYENGGGRHGSGKKRIPIREEKIRKAGDYINNHVQEQAEMCKYLRDVCGRMSGFSIGLENTLLIIEGYMNEYKDLLDRIEF